MTGLDCLRDEMEKRGLGKQQINSKIVAVVLDIVSQSGNKYTGMWKDENEASKRKSDLDGAIRLLERRQKNLVIDIEKARRNLGECETRKREIEEYVKKLCNAIDNCDTQEGRDTMRLAQMFVNSVDVDTKYDNTAYIIGLAAILSKGGINAIDELRKINKKMPGGRLDAI